MRWQPHAMDKHQESIPKILGRLARDSAETLRLYIELVKTEAKQDLVSTIWGIGLLIAGGIVLFVALIIFVVAAVFALSIVIPGWAAALAVGAALLLLGLALVLVGRPKIRTRPLAVTRQAVEEGIAWLKQQADLQNPTPEPGPSDPSQNARSNNFGPPSNTVDPKPSGTSPS